MDGDQPKRIAQKWGFGMAPVKPDVAAQRLAAVNEVLDLLERGRGGDLVTDQVSVVKGLYARSYKQDQWDWFTVWRQLGRPGRKTARRAAQVLAELRRAVRDSDVDAVARCRLALGTIGALDRLRRFPDTATDLAPGTGYVYVLSTREMPTMLKIGYTERDIEDRVKEINRATGVLIPFGVRAVWVVRNAPQVEATIHSALDDYRVRRDREFFQIDFYKAFVIIRDAVYASRGEV